ncbi:hypothetical protein HNR19_001632 [Nocardioides thalensis]|uniref:Uncharacterized protein n=1 Tax=Nocardioides thalensis TaxID=1914755 RepID=A0A853C0Z4_9ACTN|nr:hypothetical protein [Nocardioides thalensis]NYJ00934.1 hypothetical protein [Nocardioides thalensis]
MNGIDLTTRALRELDAAPPTGLTVAERERADAMLARILATPVDPSTDAPAPAAPARRRRRQLLAGMGLAGATGVAVPALLLGGGSAFGSWTPTPEPLTDAAADEAAETCRNHSGLPDRGERVVIAEQRGAWTYVLIAGPEAELVCLIADETVDRDEYHADGVFMGSSGEDPPAAPKVAADGIRETESAGSTVPDDELLPWADDDDWFSWVEGYVGSDVTGVTVHTPSGMEIEASVNGGRFAAWWPAGEATWDNPEVGGAWSYTLTLADGTTRDAGSGR